MGTNQNVWTSEQVVSVDKEREKDQIHYVASSVSNSMLPANRPKS